MKYRAFAFVLLLSSIAAAQTPPIETVPEGEDRITPLRLNEPAPYSGQLFDPPTALRWANWLQQYKLRLKIDVEAEREGCDVKLKAADATLNLHVEAHDKLQKDLRGHVLKLERKNMKLEEELRNPPFFKSRAFGLILGTVGTAAAFGLSVWAVDSLRR